MTARRALGTPHDVERFRDVVARRFGLHLDETRLAQLGEVLSERAAARGAEDASAYLDRFSSLGQAELDAVAPLVTVGETFFFRNPDNFRALVERVLPERIAARGADRTLRILSAGCASGEEPYSIAMHLRDALGDVDAWDIEITALDVNPDALARAAEARYSAWSLRATSDELRTRWFRAEGSAFLVDPAVRRMVTFRRANLADASALGLTDGAYDVVFCRNVLMYLGPEVAAAAVGRLRAALAAGGFLFLGHAETMRGLSQGFDLCATHDTFYYQRSAEPAPARPDAPPEAGDAWALAIERASKQIAALEDRSGRASTPRSDAPALPDADLALVMIAMREERFEDALSLLDALAAPARATPEMRLLRAVLLTNATRIDEAGAACRELLAANEAGAGAHYLLALHAAHAGDDGASLDHARRACELDPTFAMARLQWGIVARRRGIVDVARRVLGEASELLAREDAARIALFGGGFSREALLRVCKDERRAVESAR